MKSRYASFGFHTAFSNHWLLCLTFLAAAFDGGRAMQMVSASAETIQPLTLAVRSAASYTEPVAPDSIAALFGQKLATRIEVANTIPLPTTLAGTTVTVDGQPAMLFFVSPGQINFLMPAGTRAGRVDVAVRSGDGLMSQGTVQVQSTAPSVFTQNADGKGIPAAQIIRLRNGIQTTELPYQLVGGRYVTRPIDLGPPSDQVAVVLYLTGLRRATNPLQSVKLEALGQKLSVDYAGAQPDFAGLDQVNATLRRELLANRGIVNFTVTIPGAIASNSFDLEFRQSSGGGIVIESFDPTPATVGQALSINGRGFSPNKDKNQVRILGAGAQYEALVTEATASLLTVLIPFGAESGVLSVNNLEPGGSYANSTQNLTIKTSVSGAFKDSAGNKIKGMKVRVVDARGSAFNETTNDDGLFVIPGLAAGTTRIELGDPVPSGQLPYPQVVFKQSVVADRDNLIEYPGTLQAINGTPSNLNPDGTPQERSLRLSVPIKTASAAPDKEIRNGEVVLNLPDNAVIAFPDGRPVNQITLSLVARSLTPVELPERHFSQTIVMISPLGATIKPGAKLTFPNSDGFAANAHVQLFRLNQQRDTDQLGEFVSAGTATVSADGKIIETTANAIQETTYYFASLLRPALTVTGTVVETGQLPLPVSGALMGSRGRGTKTDPNGNFSVRNVPFNATALQLADGAVIDLSRQNLSVDPQAQAVADLISLEANYVRPTRVVSHREKNDITPTGDGGSTSAGTIELGAPPANNPPLIQGPSSITVKVGQSLDFFEFSVQVSPSQSVTVSISGVKFASVTFQGNGVYKLAGMPVVADIGNYTLAITAINNLGQTATKLIPVTVTP